MKTNSILHILFFVVCFMLYSSLHAYAIINVEDQKVLKEHSTDDKTNSQLPESAAPAINNTANPAKPASGQADIKPNDTTLIDSYLTSNISSIKEQIKVIESKVLSISNQSKTDIQQLNEFIKSHTKKINEIESQLIKINKQANQYNTEFNKKISILTIEENVLYDQIIRIRNELKTLSETVSKNQSIQLELIKQLESQLKKTANSVNVHSNVIENRSIALPIISITLLFVLVVFFVYIRKRICSQQNSISDLVYQVHDLNEEIIKIFVGHMHKLEDEYNATVAIVKSDILSKNLDEQHAIVKIIADKLTFMEVTMTKMDSSVRGYKQLSKSISQMKDNLKATGYEIVEMLGKPYNAGMRVVANFIDDPDFEQGRQMITGIIKPQINYRGVMIQSAQIVVTQNI